MRSVVVLGHAVLYLLIAIMHHKHHPDDGRGIVICYGLLGVVCVIDAILLALLVA